MDSQEAVAGSPSTATKSRPPRPLQSSRPKTQYLILYNFVSALCWLVVLGRVCAMVPLFGFGKVYLGVGQWVKWTQTAAVLEVLHAALGIVRAPVFTTGMQVSSRLFLVWLIIEPFPALAKSAVYSSMLLAWSLTEVIRYTYFTLSLSGLLPDFWERLRYSTFFVLYPLGITSESLLIWRATGPAAAVRQEWKWALQAILGIYVPGAYILFTHMMAQRRKMIRAKQLKRND